MADSPATKWSRLRGRQSRAEAGDTDAVLVRLGEAVWRFSFRSKRPGKLGSPCEAKDRVVGG